MLAINKVVFSIMSGSTELTSLLSGKTFPIVAKEGTECPFLVFKRDSYTSTYTKDSVSNDIRLKIDIVTNIYSQGIDIIECIRLLFENKRVDNKIFRVESAGEDYDGAYIQTINLIIKD